MYNSYENNKIVKLILVCYLPNKCGRIVRYRYPFYGLHRPCMSRYTYLMFPFTSPYMNRIVIASCYYPKLIFKKLNLTSILCFQN